MGSGFDESTSASSNNRSFSANGGNDAEEFECNICFELAQDPVVTLCGHLFCWPCLYRWLHHHSHSQECPVCKALIQQETLIPLYGRGKTQTDPRTKSYPGMEIPRRPTGQRPQTASPTRHNPNQFSNFGFGFMGGFVPMATARFGNFTLGTAFGGIFPYLFNIQFHGFPDANGYGTNPGFPFGFNSFNGGYGQASTQGSPEQQLQQQNADSMLKNMFLMIGICVLLFVLWW